MPRPAPTPASAAATLADALTGPRPAWITAATWRSLRAVVARLRADAAAAIDRDGAVDAAEAMGVHRDTLRSWRTAGWLRAPQDATQGAPDDAGG